MDPTCMINDNIQKLLAGIDKLTVKLDNDSADAGHHVWLDIQDASSLLRVTKRTLQNYRRKGLLSSSRMGGKIYYRLDDIENFLQRNYSKTQPIKPRKK
jgi:hypothetical protein